MAYKPPRGVSRQALVAALIQRLSALLGDENPIIPPRPPFRGESIVPPRVPPRAQPVRPPMGPPRTQGWVPPSARDWVRQPGFFTEDRNPVPVGRIEEDGSYLDSAGRIFDPELQGFRRSRYPGMF